MSNLNMAKLVAAPVVLPSIMEAIRKAKALEYKLARIAAMKKSYKFRLSAMVATDTRLGKVWH